MVLAIRSRPRVKTSILALFVGLFGVLAVFLLRPAPTQAATSTYFNFQMRLLTSAGAVVADGNYHVEFKLYNAANSTGSTQGSCSGDSNCLWTEIRSTGNLVRVVNGYFSVQLGSVTALPSINYNQQLWLGVRIGGKDASPSWETIELTSDGTATGNKIQLTAVPYAFSANQLQATSGSITNTLTFATPSSSNKTITIPNETGTVCTTGSVCSGYAAAGSVTLQGAYNAGSAGDQLIQLSAANDSLIFRNPDTGGSNSAYILTLEQLEDDTGTLGGLSIQSAGTGNLLLVTDTTATAADVFTIADGGATTFKNQTNSASAFQIQYADGSPLFAVETLGGKVGVGTSGGVAKLTADTDPGENLVGLEIRQQDTTYNNAAVTIANSGTGNSLQIDTTEFVVSSTGATAIRPSSNTSTAFQIQNAAGTTNLLTADTSNLKLTTVGDVNVGNRYGNRLFSDNFEIGSLGLWDGVIGQGISSIDTTTVRAGKYAYKVDITSNSASVEKSIATSNTVYARAWVNFTSQAAATTVDMLYLATGTGSSINSLYRNNSTNQLCVWNAVAGSSAGCGGSWSGSGWHLVELRTTVDTSTTGVIQAWLDGTQVVNLSAQNNGTTPIGSVVAGSRSNRTATFYIDDVSADTAANGTASSLNVDDSLHVGGSASFGSSALFQSVSNNTTAFQIQNAIGSNALLVGTSPLNTLINNGSIEGMDNSNWGTKAGTVSETRDTTQQYIGAASEKIAFTTTAVGDGAKYTFSNGALSASTTYRLSFYIKQTAGTALGTNLTVGFNSGSDTNCTLGPTLTEQPVPTTGWARYFCNITTDGTPTTGDFLYWIEADAPGSARTFFIDGLQLQQTSTILSAFQESTLALNGVITSPVAFRNTNDSTTAFQIQSAAGAELLTADTVNNFVRVGTNSSTVPARLIIANNWSDTSGDNAILDVVEGELAGELRGGRLRYNSGDNTIYLGGIFLSTEYPVLQFGRNGNDVKLINNAGAGAFTILNKSTSAGILIKPDTGADRTDAFQIQNASSANLFVADTTNSRIYIGNPTADSTGVILVLDTKNTAGDPTGINGGLYYNSSSAKFRCYEASIWWDCLSPSPDKQRRMPFYSSELFINSSTFPWTTAAINSGTLQNKAGVANHPGLVRMSSSTTANSGYQLTLDGGSFLLAGGETTEISFNLDSLTNNTIRWGFLDTNGSGDATDGAYIEIPSTGAAVCKTANNNTRTTSSTIATLSTATWYRARITVNADATLVTCEIFNDSGTSLGSQSNSANIPTTSGRETSNKVIATNSGTTATDLISIDYMALWWDRILTR